MLFDERRVLTDAAPRRLYKPTVTSAAASCTTHTRGGGGGGGAARGSNNNNGNDGSHVCCDDGDDDVAVVKGLHWGQRKLLLAEVEFLSAVLEQRQRPSQHQELAGSAAAAVAAADTAGAAPTRLPLLVVYAGAAPGLHLPLLFRLFPRVRFVLIDPAPFCVEVRAYVDATTATTAATGTAAAAAAADTAAATAVQRGSGAVLELLSACCTDELCARLAREYAASYDILLISDIRSGNPYLTRSNDEHTQMVLRDCAQQRSWCDTLGARAALLKFHPPYPDTRHDDDDGGSDSSAHERATATATATQTMTYLDGVALWGVWAPKSSSEVRLVPFGPFASRDTTRCSARERVYDCRQHEEQCYYYNTTARYARDVCAERVIWQRYVRVCPADAVAALASSNGEVGDDSHHDHHHNNNNVSGCSDDDDVDDDGAASLVRALSSHASVALRHRLFCPLARGYTEDDARWAHLLYSTRHPAAVSLYEPYKACMTRRRVVALVRTYATAAQWPRHVRVDGVELTALFWRVFCRGNFTEAYSLPPVRWSFATSSTPGPPHAARTRGVRHARSDDTVDGDDGAGGDGGVDAAAVRDERRHAVDA